MSLPLLLGFCVACSTRGCKPEPICIPICLAVYCCNKALEEAQVWAHSRSPDFVPGGRKHLFRQAHAPAPAPACPASEWHSLPTHRRVSFGVVWVSVVLWPRQKSRCPFLSVTLYPSALGQMACASRAGTWEDDSHERVSSLPVK